MVRKTSGAGETPKMPEGKPSPKETPPTAEEAKAAAVAAAGGVTPKGVPSAKKKVDRKKLGPGQAKDKGIAATVAHATKTATIESLSSQVSALLDKTDINTVLLGVLEEIDNMPTNAKIDTLIGGVKTLAYSAIQNDDETKLDEIIDFLKTMLNKMTTTNDLKKALNVLKQPENLDATVAYAKTAKANTE